MRIPSVKKNHARTPISNFELEIGVPRDTPTVSLVPTAMNNVIAIGKCDGLSGLLLTKNMKNNYLCNKYVFCSW